MFFAGSTLVLGMWLDRRSDGLTLRLLGGAILIQILHLIQLVAKDTQISNLTLVFERPPLQLNLALGPLIYFYTQRIISPKFKFSSQRLLHFVPLFLQLATQCLFISDIYFSNGLTGRRTFELLGTLSNILMFISISIYLFLSRKLILKFYKNVAFIGNDRLRTELRWFQKSLYIYSWAWLLWLPITISNFFYHKNFSESSYYPLHLITGIILIWMGAKAFLRSDRGVIISNAPVLKHPSSLELRHKGLWLKRIVKEEKYYQDPELSLNTLAKALDLSVHELSRIINQALKKTFNDFINEYRVADVIRKMQDPSYNHLTLLGISFESGFNSKTSFQRVFKEMTGTTPAEYKLRLDKEGPNYNMAPPVHSERLISNHQTTNTWLNEIIRLHNMFKNSIKTAWRNLKKNKVYSALNIIGLTVGTVCAALIFLWVEDELTFNQNFAKHDYLYHVMQNEKNDVGINTNGSTPGPLAAALKADVPGIVNSGRLSWAMDELVTLGEKTLKVNGMYADPSVLSMYTLHFVNGNRSTALNHPNDVVISETMSRNVFGDTSPIGKTIKMNAKGAYSVDGLYTVTGVFSDLPANCYYHFQWLSPYTTWENANTWLKPWNNNLTETVVELSPKANPAGINKRLKNYLATKVDKATNQCFLFSMNDWHLRSNFVNGVQDGGSIKYVRLFSLIAFMILLIACINFMNLSTARSEQRSKEVGVLKVMGADKVSLVAKFLSESILLAFIAILITDAALYLIMPFYNELVQKQLSVDLFDPLHFSFLIGTGLIVGVVAGCYPAFYLSAFNPIRVLKGMKLKNSGSVIFIRKGLVITQFTASIILIISTIVVYKQVEHIKDRNLGYNKSRLVYMNIQGNMKAHFASIKNSLVNTGYVENATASLHDALHIYSVGDGFGWQGKNPASKLGIHSNVVSSEYLKTMHMKLVRGRDFYPGNIDSTNVIVNESMIKLMGKAGQLGEVINSGTHSMTIVGIIKDFIYNDIYGSSAPLILFNGSNSATVMALRFKPNVDLSKALAATADVMKRENPGFPFEYTFADKDFETLFSSETLIGKLAGLFSMLAVFISCLGLFGLAAYTAERRTKEIGIRKVLGASVTGLAGLLAKEFLQLVILSCLIAFPIAWWLMYDWLQNFTYRTSIHYWFFMLAGVTALLVSLLTVSFQAISAAMANPVKSLRSE